MTSVINLIETCKYYFIKYCMPICLINFVRSHSTNLLNSRGEVNKLENSSFLTTNNTEKTIINYRAVVATVGSVTFAVT